MDMVYVGLTVFLFLATWGLVKIFESLMEDGR